MAEPDPSGALLRPVRPEEIWDLRAWRNAPRVRQAMVTQHAIGEDEHAAWFARRLADPTSRLMVTEHAGERVAVQAFFDLVPGGEAWWAFYFTPAVPEASAAMMQTWKWVELTGLRYAFEGLGLHTLRCEVRRENAGVLAWHRRFGFTACDPSVSKLAAAHDLEVLALDRAGYDHVAARAARDLTRACWAPHPADPRDPP